MKRFKSRRYFHIPILLIPLIILLIIIILIFKILSIISPKIIDVATTKLDNMSYTLIIEDIKKDENIIKLKDIIILDKDKNDNIVALHYDMDKTYYILDLITNDMQTYLNSKLHNMELSFPIGMFSNNVFIANMGPKVKAKVGYISNLVTNIDTKVENYGINNALVKVYLTIDITNNIVIPLRKEDISSHYDILVATSLVFGKVPSYLDGLSHSISNK